MDSFNLVRYEYKMETGSYPDVNIEYNIYRSKGKWVLDISDEDAIRLNLRVGSMDSMDVDYFNWLENKVLELLNQKK